MTTTVSRYFDAQRHRRFAATTYLSRRWQATVVLATVPEGDVTLQLQGTGLKA